MLDVNTLEQLAQDTSPEMLPSMLAAFREEADSRIRAIAQHLSPPEMEQLQWAAHSPKSSAGTFGAFELHQLALELELACRSGQPEDAGEKALRIPEAWRQVSMELDRYLADSAAASNATS